MGISWEFSVKRNQANMVPTKKMEQYVFAAKILETVLKQKEENNK
jgi:hypothetical protein